MSYLDDVLEAAGFKTTSTPGVHVTYTPTLRCVDMTMTIGDRTYDIKQTAGRAYRRQQMEEIDIEIGAFYVHYSGDRVCQTNGVHGNKIEFTNADDLTISTWEIHEFEKCWQILPEVEEGSVWLAKGGTEALQVSEILDESVRVAWNTGFNGKLSFYSLYAHHRFAKGRVYEELDTRHIWEHVGHSDKLDKHRLRFRGACDKVVSPQVLSESFRELFPRVNTNNTIFQGLASDGYYDAVNFPSHYDVVEGVQAIDIIEAKVPDFGSYCEGNVIKYLMRWRDKNGVEDLKKAQRYLEWLIAAEEGDNG